MRRAPPRSARCTGRPRSTAHALACKLQYPDMASAVEADLRQLRLAMGLYERYDRAVTTAEIHAEIAERLREELDYEREAAHMRLYGAILRDEPGAAVPAPYPELSTRRLLTMTWLDGAPILDTAEAPLARRNLVARHMFRTWYLPFYHYGVIHGDPHLGNYTVEPGAHRQSPRLRLCAHFRRLRSCAALSTSTTPCSAATATSRSTPTRAGASAISRAR